MVSELYSKWEDFLPSLEIGPRSSPLLVLELPRAREDQAAGLP